MEFILLSRDNDDIVWIANIQVKDIRIHGFSETAGASPVIGGRVNRYFCDF